VDESGLSTSDVKQWLTASAGDYYIGGSGGIGWGLAASVGIALARPAREVVAIVGDGSSLYNSEALWTAAHHGARHTLVVLSNRRYATLNEGAARVVGKPELGLYSLEPPVIDFAGLAQLYGYRYCPADSEASLARALAPSGANAAPRTLIDVRLDPTLKPVTAARRTSDAAAAISTGRARRPWPGEPWVLGTGASGPPWVIAPLPRRDESGHWVEAIPVP
jgi:benzoylformate decarboxylase